MSELFYSPKPAVSALWLRIIVFGFLAYNLLSRDWTVFAYASDLVLSMVPSVRTGRILGVEFIIDIASFHWVHWFLPMPGIATLKILQFSGVFLCFLVVLFGRGRYNLLAIATYILLSYLWGFIWRSGAAHDGVTLLLQISFIYCFMRFKEYPLWHLKKSQLLEYKPEYGAFFSLNLIIFVIYYLSSGIKKYIDIPITDWFAHDLYHIQFILAHHADFGHLIHVPAYDFIIFSPLVKYILVPLVYIEHTLTPMMYFKRRLITQFFIFYTCFHLMSLLAYVMFIGLIVAWFVFLPVERFIEPITVTGSSKKRRYIKLLKKLNWLNLLKFDEKSTDKGLQIKDSYSKRSYTGFDAFRRTLWAYPLGWILILPVYIIYYFPVLYLVTSWIEKSYTNKKSSKATT
jgi:hypothetical protein